VGEEKIIFPVLCVVNLDYYCKWGKKKKFPVEIESLKLDFYLGGMMVNNCQYKSSFKGLIYTGLFTSKPLQCKSSV